MLQNGVPGNILECDVRVGFDKSGQNGGIAEIQCAVAGLTDFLTVTDLFNDAVFIDNRSILYQIVSIKYPVSSKT